MTERVVRNDWSSVTVPDLDGWRPSHTVSVVIPAFGSQATLDLTLASLSRQTYPAELLEVIVVDDGSEPALTLPKIRPERTTLLRLEDSRRDGWGRSNALRYGAAHSSGKIIHWLDADMVVYPEHVAAQARWQHVLPYAVTLGYKRFVDPDVHQPWPSAETVAQSWDRGAPGDLFGGDPGEPHDYVERYLAQTDQLRAADHHAYKVHVGATAALSRELYDATGGLDPELRLGEDTEFGYRLAQAGAVFIPEPLARSWHLGRTHVQRAQEQVSRYNKPFLADRIPSPRHWRRTGGPTWTVPLVDVVLPVDDQNLEGVRATVDAILRGSIPDVRVTLVGAWEALDDARVRVLADPMLDLRLIAASYRAEPRVRFVAEAPASSFPATYRLDLPGPREFAPDALRYLIDVADRHRVGVVRISDGDGPAAMLWRTAAIGRAGWVRRADESLLDAVTAVYGRRDEDAAVLGGGRRSASLVPTMVEVEGVRSLARATVVVAWLGWRRLVARLRRVR